eukprot:gene8938-12053_t
MGWQLSSSLKNSYQDSIQKQSLLAGQWVKFIAGASNEDIPLIRNLCFVYAMVGVDCIDVSANPAVLHAAYEGIISAINNTNRSSKSIPHLMISVNDDEDLHFRKAYFDVNHCPIDCKRPCEKVCPALAIPKLVNPGNDQQFSVENNDNINDNHQDLYPNSGVIIEKCYGCGRCMPVCPYGLIDTITTLSDRNMIIDLISAGLVDGIEIHTQLKNLDSFQKLWSEIGSSVLSNLKIISVSFPEISENKTFPQIQSLFNIISNHDSWTDFVVKNNGINIWQTDGRPMSGDIGRGTVSHSVKLANHILNEATSMNHGLDNIDFNSGRHFAQLAGGTNNYSSQVVESSGLSGKRGFGGYAFGGYARKKLGRYLNDLESYCAGSKIEDYPEILDKCLQFANSLLLTVKRKS